MRRRAHVGWLVLSPPFPENGEAHRTFQEHARRLAQLLDADEPDGDEGRRVLETSLKSSRRDEHGTGLKAVLCVLSDLASQRWGVRVTDDGTVLVKRPDADRLDSLSEKARIREQELIKRDEQLRQPATREFVRSMERQSVRAGRFVSIFSVMRDGRELADALRIVRRFPLDARIDPLRKVVDPYLQFVDDKAKCPHTGLRLQDIWRYFRHTWTNQYTSTPGRSLAFLVRDRAREFHPIIGIGALGSSIVQISERDAWIGWDSEAFLEFSAEEPSAELGDWLSRIVDTAVAETFLDDFVESGLIRPGELRAPTEDTIARLAKYGEEQRDLHRRFANSKNLKRTPQRNDAEGDKRHWCERAQTHLYRSKRARSLADMLQSRRTLRKSLGDKPTPEQVKQLVQSSQGRQIVKKILRKAKADRVGIAMADITVCGAVPPYNSILGGKLVAMLAASPEVVAAYRQKYMAQESEIASSMAGRPIVRPSELVFLGTTSLYGVGSSQYNRLHMPVACLGGREDERLRFLEIGKSEAYGTSHFSAQTVEALVSLVQQSTNGQRVNSIFGEGVNPKLRKIRDGLDALNLPTDALLKHGRHRIVYGVPLVRNLREFLLGMDESPDYLFDLDRPENATDCVAYWWTKRWLSKRIDNKDALARIAANTLVSPIRHGSRVMLPKTREEDDQLLLFENLD